MRIKHLLVLLPALAWACSDDSTTPPKQDTGPKQDTNGGWDSGSDWAIGDTGGSDFVWPDQGSDGGVTTETTIPKIKDGTLAEMTKVLLKDVIITAVDDSGAYTGNVYVQEAAGGKGSGIVVYKPTRTDSGGTIADLKPGDHVKVTGEVKHYAPSSGWNVTSFPSKTVVRELIKASITYISSGSAPTPMVVTLADLTTDPKADSYEHVLVTVKSAKVTALPNTYGEFTLDGKLGVDDELYVHTPKANDCIDVTGVVDFFYGYKVYVRAAGDIQTATGCAVPPTVKINDIQDKTSTKHPSIGTQVTVTGIITAVDASKDGGSNYSGFFIQDQAGGSYSGIYVYHQFTDASTVKPVLGELVELTGTYDEYQTVSELKNATWTKKSSATLPTPIKVAAKDVSNTGTKGEEYEGVLIEVGAMTVSSVAQDSKGKNVSFVDATSGLHVDHMLYDDFLNPTPPTVGTKYTKIVGPLHYSFSAFRIAPRAAADLVK
jgi:predicted extracellular nuclease